MKILIAAGVFIACVAASLAFAEVEINGDIHYHDETLTEEEINGFDEQRLRDELHKRGRVCKGCNDVAALAAGLKLAVEFDAPKLTKKDQEMFRRHLDGDRTTNKEADAFLAALEFEEERERDIAKQRRELEKKSGQRDNAAIGDDDKAEI